MSSKKQYYPVATLSTPSGPSNEFILSGMNTSNQSDYVLYDTYIDYNVQRLAPRKKIILQGKLLSSFGRDWEKGFIDNYQKHWKASQCIKNKTSITLKVKDKMVKGYMTGLSITKRKMHISDFEAEFLPITEMSYGNKQESSIPQNRTMGERSYYLKSTFGVWDSLTPEGTKSSDSFEFEFILKQINKRYSEKYQLGYSQIITQGSRPIAATVNIDLVESEKHNPKIKMCISKLGDILSINKNALFFMSYANSFIGGYITNSTINERASLNYETISFSMILKQDTMFRIAAKNIEETVA